MSDALTEFPRPRVTTWGSCGAEFKHGRMEYIVDAASVAELDVASEEIAVELTPYGSGDLAGMDLTPTNDDAFTSVAAARKAVECALTVLQY